MKTLLAFLLALFALNAKAIPFLTVDLIQDNWTYSFTFTVHDRVPVEERVVFIGNSTEEFFIDGSKQGQSDGTIDTFSMGGGYVQAYPGTINSPGEHTIMARFYTINGIIESSVNFTIATPTGPRPVVPYEHDGIPDGGSALGLLALSAVALAGLRKRH
jgi:hypothetical protein